MYVKIILLDQIQGEEDLEEGFPSRFSVYFWNLEYSCYKNIPGSRVLKT